MNNFLVKVLINFVIGIIVVVGFFVFWGRSNGWFKKGGFVFEYYKSKKEEKNNLKKQRKSKE